MKRSKITDFLIRIPIIRSFIISRRSKDVDCQFWNVIQSFNEDDLHEYLFRNKRTVLLEKIKTYSKTEILGKEIRKIAQMNPDVIKSDLSYLKYFSNEMFGLMAITHKDAKKMKEAIGISLSINHRPLLLTTLLLKHPLEYTLKLNK